MPQRIFATGLTDKIKQLNIIPSLLDHFNTKGTVKNDTEFPQKGFC